MKVIVFTNNSIRHKFVANMISAHFNTYVISECMKDTLSGIGDLSLTAEHFNERYEIEKSVFKDNLSFINAQVFPIRYKELNKQFVIDAIKEIKPDYGVVYGSYILKDELIGLFPKGNLVGIHLGLSPYYRGSGTNFFPFVNDELQYVGSTIYCIDKGIDTGDIITHTRPAFYHSDNVHTIGCRVISHSVYKVTKIINDMMKGIKIKTVKQWKVDDERYYENSDFNEKILLKYKDNMSDNMILRYIKKEKEKEKIKLVKNGVIV